MIDLFHICFRLVGVPVGTESLIIFSILHNFQTIENSRWHGCFFKAFDFVKIRDFLMYCIREPLIKVPEFGIGTPVLAEEESAPFWSYDFARQPRFRGFSVVSGRLPPLQQ